MAAPSRSDCFIGPKYRPSSDAGCAVSRKTSSLWSTLQPSQTGSIRSDESTVFAIATGSLLIRISSPVRQISSPGMPAICFNNGQSFPTYPRVSAHPAISLWLETTTHRPWLKGSSLSQYSPVGALAVRFQIRRSRGSNTHPKVRSKMPDSVSQKLSLFTWDHATVQTSRRTNYALTNE